MAEAVVDELELVEVEQHHGQPGVVPARSRERLREAIEEQRAVGQAGERVVQRLVADDLLGLAPGDGIPEHVGHRLHEARVEVVEVPRRAVVDTERSEGLRALADQHAHAALHAEAVEEVVGPVRALEVVERKWAVAQLLEAGSVHVGHRAAGTADHASGEAVPGRETNAPALVAELQDADEVDVERVGDRLRRLVEKAGGLDALEGVLAEPCDRRLLLHAPPQLLLCVQAVGHVDGLGDELGGRAVAVAQKGDADERAHRAAVGAQVALGRLDVVDLPVEQPLHRFRVGLSALGVRDLLEGELEHLLGGAAHHPAHGRVHGLVAPVDRDDRDANRRVVHRSGDGLLPLAQLLGGQARVGDVEE